MPNAVDAIIFCGGAGLRLKGVTGDTPKSLTSIGERPFLEILLRQLQRHGFDRVILAVGYQKELIRSQFGDQARGLKIGYSIESTPLGTGGALRNALGLMEANCALIMNGDSYTDANLRLFSIGHQNTSADVSVLVVPADGRTDCGLVSVDSDERILGFREKQSASGKQYVNAGIYMASKQILGEIPTDTQVSLEAELFPRWLGESKHLRAFHYPGRCVDIGTPDRYREAQVTLANVEAGDALAEGERQRV
jgi:D-glycero-alpha-D-manno-heptose 1-phosphate guanylyltransferase